MRKVMLLVLSLAITFTGAWIGNAFTFQSVTDWYPTLNKPFFNPPNWIFGPVWSVLYLMMGVSLFLVLKSKSDSSKRTALLIYLSQLFFNSLWSVVFFGYRSPFLALFVIIFLWVLIILTIKEFKKHSNIAALMLVPYLLWVSFATVLNFSIMVLN